MTADARESRLRLEIDRHSPAEDEGIAQILGAARVDDKLRIGLDIHPWREIGLIGDLEDHFRTDSARTFELQVLARAVGQLSIDEAHPDLVFIAGRNWPRINQPALNIESDKIAILRPESDAPEPAESLIGRLFLDLQRSSSRKRTIFRPC